MNIRLVLVPILAALAFILLYRHSGKREFFYLDAIQFFETFIVVPLLFLWLKELLFVVMRSQPGLSLGEYVVVDSIFSVLFLFVYAFIVMHAVTASIKLHQAKKTSLDIMHHTEYFHLWLSHLGMFFGVLALIVAAAIMNVLLPFEQPPVEFIFRSMVGVGLAGGILLFVGVWLSNPRQHQVDYMQLIQLTYSVVLVGFLVHWFIDRVPFQPAYGLYWAMASGMIGFVGTSWFAHRHPRTQTWLEKFTHSFGWGENIQLFTKKKSRKDV